MLPIEPTQIYPCFYACKNEAEFQDLDTQACEMLNFPDAGATDYCNPIIDVNGVYYFTVNPEVTSLFTQSQLDSCVQYEDIPMPTPEPIA
jgi:hypothetical protein